MADDEGALLSYGHGGATPGWYPDPSGGGQRYYDGYGWTAHVAPPAALWKGARYGRPPTGPGSLANPGIRLLARFLDGLVFLPVTLVIGGIAIALIAAHAGPIFPKTNPDGTLSSTPPGFVWLYVGLFAVFAVQGVLFVAYEAIATARYGRTLGKRWVKIRPITTEGHALGDGRSWGRAALVWVANLLGWLGLLDSLWCLWDGDSQCVHDKIATTLVVND